jgi:hypothetical protein
MPHGASQCPQISIASLPHFPVMPFTDQTSRKGCLEPSRHPHLAPDVFVFTVEFMDWLSVERI